MLTMEKTEDALFWVGRAIDRLEEAGLGCRLGSRTPGRRLMTKLRIAKNWLEDGDATSRKLAMCKLAEAFTMTHSDHRAEAIDDEALRVLTHADVDMAIHNLTI